MEEVATIWKMDRFATHDGPGVRTNIYFKGCPLRCLWCSNPEGQLPERELGFTEARCTGCGLCFDACPRGAIIRGDGIPVIDSTKCDLCGQCVHACPTEALHIYGDIWALPWVMDAIEKDRHIYRRSGGGITCTGGEPLLQAGFVQRLLARCRHAGIHTALETCGCVEEEIFGKTIPLVDWLFFDIKHLDSRRHEKLTCRDNALILRNLKTASTLFSKTDQILVIRQVIVPGLNDEENVQALAELAASLPRLHMIEILPYHAYGLHKYRSLGREYRLHDLEPPSEDRLQEYKNAIESQGIQCKIGGF